MGHLLPTERCWTAQGIDLCENNNDIKSSGEYLQSTYVLATVIGIVCILTHLILTESSKVRAIIVPILKARTKYGEGSHQVSMYRLALGRGPRQPGH